MTEKRIIAIGTNAPRKIIRWMGVNGLLKGKRLESVGEDVEIIVLSSRDEIFILHPTKEPA